ncbi:MAG: mechanosensitive ion channel family protein [Lachnospiraceae bacterium]|nr:mechanosensitive ion channel family protein [Lachnospiraceae bacterium]
MSEEVKTPQEEPVKKPNFFKENKKSLIRIAIWVGILLVFLVLTNPSIIPFLSPEAKDTIKTAWTNIFGDVGKIAQTVTINWATLFQVAVIIMVMVIITKVVGLILSKINPKRPKARSLVTLTRSALVYITTLVAIFWCLSAIGVNVSTIFASVGIIALIIGFGAQSLVEDMVTGIFLVFEDQFNVGDIIEVAGFRGTVQSIGLRTTAIRDVGNNIKVINNSDLRNILNKSAASSMAVTTCSISYKHNIAEVEEKIVDILPKIYEAHTDIFKATPRYIGVQELGDSGVVLKFVAEVEEKNVFSGPRILNRELKYWFDQVGIEIPFNQVVIHQAKE